MSAQHTRRIATCLLLAGMVLVVKSQISEYNFEQVKYVHVPATPSISPAITEPPTDTLAATGGSATFTCSAETSDEEPFEISWLFAGEPLQPSSKHMITGDGMSLTITGVDSDDLGEYTCQVEGGSGGTAEASASLGLAGKLYVVTKYYIVLFKRPVHCTWLFWLSLFYFFTAIF